MDKIKRFLKTRFPHKTYMRGGYRWHELKFGRRRWITWQMPFTRTYSIAWSQAEIDKSVELGMAEVKNSLVGEAEYRRRIEAEEHYFPG